MQTGLGVVAGNCVVVVVLCKDDVVSLNVAVVSLKDWLPALEALLDIKTGEGVVVGIGVVVVAGHMPLHGSPHHLSCPHPACPALLFGATKPAGHAQASMPFSMPSSAVLFSM